MRQALLAALLGLAGCTGMPSSGPSASAFFRTQSPGEDLQSAGIALVPVDARVLAFAAPERRSSFRSIADIREPLHPGLGVGDVVSITIVEADVGGLFTSGGVAGGGSPMSRLPDQAIGRDGSVTIPYAGRVEIAGLSPGVAEGRIVAALRGRAVEPQAVISVVDSASTSVTVTGDAVSGRSVPLPTGGLRLLDAIARAGGPTAPIAETAVALTRGGRTVQLPFAVLVSDPRENVYLKAGDAVLLTRQPRTVVVLGATGRNAELPLAGYDTTLAEVIAKGGGLDAFQAHAGGVFVLRDVPGVEAAQLLGAPALASGPSVSVAFQFDLSEPAGLIYAQRFAMRDGDMVFTATARLAEIRNALSVFQGIASPAASGAAAAATF